MKGTSNTVDTGTYGPNFFGYSVSHSAEDSRRVLGALKGNYAEKKPNWDAASEQDKDLLLLEAHESAHHHLMSSTPCGLFLWRLNEVISRDISWATEEAKKHGVAPSQFSIPRHFYEEADFGEQLVKSGCAKRETEYIVNVFRNIENCLVVRDIFFGASSARNEEYNSLNFGELSTRLNEAFSWMSDRCDIPWTGNWKVKDDPLELVFSDKRPINAHDISEAHAIAHELAVCRSFRDPSGFRKRYRALNDTTYQAGVEVGIQNLPAVSDVEFSPFLLRHRALLAFCTCMDLTVAQDRNDPLYIEDHLPWLQYSSDDIFSVGYLQEAMELLQQLLVGHIYMPGSNWSVLRDMNQMTDLENVARNMAWLGMDLQVYTFHQNAETNLSYLLSYLKKEDSAYDQVANRAFDSTFLVEYRDELFAIELNLADVYKKSFENMVAFGFDRFDNLGMQIICHLLNGSNSRNSIAHYQREQVPSPDIISSKLRHTITRHYSQAGIEQTKIDQLAEASVGLLTRLIENGKFGADGEAEFLVNNHGRFIL